MSFDKVEVRVFSGPDQVQVGSNTEPDLIVMNIGPKGDTGATGNTGPAGPNSVTSATTSDGTANLSLGDLEVVGGEIYTDGEYSHIYTQGDGAEIFTIGTDAIIYTQGADAHISTSGDSATIYTSGASGSIYTTGANAGISTAGANATMGTLGANATISTAGSAAHIQTTHASAAVKSTNFAAVESGGASLVDGSMQPCLTWSAGGRNLTIPSGTATTFNTTSYTYGTGAAAAHRTALGLTTLATTTPAANVATFLATPTSANLAAAVTDETGSGSLVFATSPTIDAPTMSGSAAFTSTTRPTSAGTGTPAATSLITLNDVVTRSPIVAILDSDLEITNNTTYQSIPMTASKNPDGIAYLGFYVSANSQYMLEATLHVNNAASPRNSKFTLSVPSGTTGIIQLFASSNDGSTANYTYGISNLAFGALNSLVSAANGGMVSIKFIIQTSGTAGVVYLQAAQQTSSATAVTIKKGSCLKMHKN